MRLPFRRAAGAWRWWLSSLRRGAQEVCMLDGFAAVAVSIVAVLLLVDILV